MRALLTVALLASLAAPAAAAPRMTGEHGPVRSDWPRSPQLAEQAAHGKFPRGPITIGTIRSWPTLSFAGQLVLKDFELKALGPHVEVWAPVGALAIESHDCSSSNPANLDLPDAQLRGLADAFERVVRPLEAGLFGTPSPRDGSRPRPEILGIDLPPDAYRGDGNRTVVLVDNFPLGGVVIPPAIEAVDRNYLIVKATGWKYAFGPAPATAAEPGPCLRNSGYAVPHAVEAILAHEYNHLLWIDRVGAGAGDSAWISEGMAEWATALTGYRDPSADAIANRAIGCFQGRQAAMVPAGWADPWGDLVGGPENSLSMWGEPGHGFACEYGAAGHAIHFLGDRFGARFVSDLFHTRGTNGIARLQRTLVKHRSRQGAEDVLRDWSVGAALDGPLDAGARLSGSEATRFTAASLRSTVEFGTPYAFAGPGARPNGADFVRLRDPAGRPLGAGELGSLEFDGAVAHAPSPVEWTVDPDGHGAGDAALYSGAGVDVIDRSIVLPVRVDPADPVLSFDARFDIEPGWDFGFVQVSSDGGRTFRSRPAQATTSEAQAGALAAIVQELPGFTGESGGWIPQTVDLSDLAGRDVLVAFRYMTDGFFNAPGMWIDNVTAGASHVSDGGSLDGVRTISAHRPDPVRLGLRLVALRADGSRAWAGDVPLDAGNDATLDAAELRELVGDDAGTVAAVVTHFDPAEGARPARYRLTVNGALQPGG